MKSRIALVPAANATGVLLAITFTLCVLFDLLFPSMAMYPAWQRLLPGFHGITWGSFLLGLVETYVYGWYFAILWVPLYNATTSRRTE